jgi:hypothetical protein
MTVSDEFTPVVIFAYNRPIHFKKTLNALSSNPEAQFTDLIIYSDGPKFHEDYILVEQVRAIAKESNGFKSITIKEQYSNRGLANSVINGVSEQLTKTNSIIVLEDDMIVSKNFLSFMNKNLGLYEKDENVASIHAYCYPIANLPDLFFIRGADCWGWATWRRAWDEFEPDGSKLFNELIIRKLKFRFNLMGSYNYTGMLKRQIAGINDSWAIRWHASMFLLNKVTLYPGKSLVQNIGFDGTGTHFLQNDTSYNIHLNDIEVSVTKIPIKVSKKATLSIVRFFYVRKVSIIINKVSIIIKKLKGK